MVLRPGMLSNLRCHTCLVAHVRHPLTHSLRCSNRQHAAAQRPHTHRATLVPQNILTDRQLGEGVLMRSTHKCHLFANPPHTKTCHFLKKKQQPQCHQFPGRGWLLLLSSCSSSLIIPQTHVHYADIKTLQLLNTYMVRSIRLNDCTNDEWCFYEHTFMSA